MERYKNLAAKSGVFEYEIGQDFIKVKFIDGRVYTYNYSHPGKYHVENMKRLALSGRGLSTYISKNIRGNYSDKSPD